ncbi:MAG: NAD(P)-binding domain-containing protein [Actinobacteria bacterium]|nr:NAD(P)-binding domain-containing protein [Actinomycetota bacterium]
MEKKIIVFNDHISHAPILKEHVDLLKKHNIEYIGTDCENEEDFLKYAKDADIIFDQGYTAITQRVIENLPKLKAILRRGIGYDNVNYKIAAKHNICVSNTPGFCADEVSTHAVALLLSFIRNIPQYHNLVKQGKWTKLGQGYENMESIWGEKVGIIGFGNIGKMIAEKLSPFRVYTYVYDPYTAIDEKKYNVKSVSLNEILKSCKYIILVCPLTKETENMLDEEQFKLLRKDCVVINLGRGKLINENILIKYLKEEKIVGAALDVFSEEPLSMDNPLLKLDNIIFSPHNAGISPKSKELSFKMSFDEIIRVAVGQAPTCRVN